MSLLDSEERNAEGVSVGGIPDDGHTGRDPKVFTERVSNAASEPPDIPSTQPPVAVQARAAIEEQRDRPLSPNEVAARRKICDALKKNPYSAEFYLIVISGKFPSHTLLSRLCITNIRNWAKIDEDRIYNLLEETCKAMGVARLILRNPTGEEFDAVVGQIPEFLNTGWYHQFCTYFVGHGARACVCISDMDCVNINAVVRNFSSVKIQRIHYFDCCRVEEVFSKDFPKIGNVAVFYATQAGQISYTGRKDGISGTSDGVTIFTRLFCELVKIFEGNFQEFASELIRRTVAELKDQDKDLNTDMCRPILSHNTFAQKVNLMKERYYYLQPQNIGVEKLQKCSCTSNQFKATWNLDIPTPPPLPHCNDTTVNPQPPRLTHFTLQTKSSKRGENWKSLKNFKPPEKQQVVFEIPSSGREHSVRLAAYYEGIEGAVYTKTKPIHSTYCPKVTCCDIIMIVVLIGIALTMGIVTGLLHSYSNLMKQYQLYPNETVETVDSTSRWIRMLCSKWTVWECPSQQDIQYDDITCTTITAQKTAEYRNETTETFIYSTNCEIVPSEHYLLPSLFYKNSCTPIVDSDAMNKYFGKRSKINVLLTLPAELDHTITNLSQFLFLVFSNYMDLSNYFSKKSSNDIEKYKILPTKPDLAHKPTYVMINFTYNVRESSFLYFVFSPPVNTTLVNASSMLVRQRLNWPVGNGKKYPIGDNKHKTKVPINLVHGEKVLCHSRGKFNDPTYICIKCERRRLVTIVIIIVGLSIFGGVGLLSVVCWVYRKRCCACCPTIPSQITRCRGERQPLLINEETDSV